MTTALRAVEESADKIKRNKVKVEEHEASLLEEEKILEGIRDSLKGNFHSFFILPKADTLSMPQTRLKSSMTKSKSSRRSFSRGRLKSTQRGLRLTSPPASVMPLRRKLLFSRHPAKKPKKT
jgi:hypothetical protein